MPYHHGLLNQPDPDRPWGRPQVPQSVISAAEEWGRNPQRPMVSPQGASIGPPQSRMSRIWDHLRHGIPRRVEEFLEPETPAEMGGLLAASVTEPAGTAIDLADLAIGFRERDIPRMLMAGGSAMLPLVSAAGIKGLLRSTQEARKVGPYNPELHLNRMKAAIRRGMRTESGELVDEDVVEQLADHVTELYSQEGGDIDLLLRNAGEYVPDELRGAFEKAVLSIEGGASIPPIVRGARAADELPMDEASRVARREGWLDPSHVKERVLHGTTHEFDAFDATRGVPESHHGQSIYFTDQPSDVGRNYASAEGPDLTGRIEREFENVLDELDEDPGILAITDPDRGAVLEAKALRIARERVVGPAARTIPAHLRLTNPVDTRPGGTHFDWKTEYLEDVDDWTEPEGALNDIMEGMQEVGDNNGIDVDDMLAKVQEQALDYDGISAEDFEKIVRRDDYVYDGFDQLTGEPLGGAGEFLRRVYQRAGYDGTIVDAEATFGRRARGVGGMEGVESATHYAVFDPKNIRSPWAAFDPAQAESANLLAGGAGLLGAGMARRQRERE